LAWLFHTRVHTHIQIYLCVYFYKYVHFVWFNSWHLWLFHIHATHAAQKAFVRQVYLYIYIYVYMYIYIHIYTCITYIYVYIYMCIYISFLRCLVTLGVTFPHARHLHRPRGFCATPVPPLVWFVPDTSTYQKLELIARFQLSTDWWFFLCYTIIGVGLICTRHSNVPKTRTNCAFSI